MLCSNGHVSVLPGSQTRFESHVADSLRFWFLSLGFFPTQFQPVCALLGRTWKTCHWFAGGQRPDIEETKSQLQPH